MSEVKTKRPFEERFLDNFDRSQLRREVAAVKPRRFQALRKKYATWALGGALALGGMGVPMKMLQPAASGGKSWNRTSAASSASTGLEGTLAGDLKAAESIAKQVAGGVVEGVEKATESPLDVVAGTPRKLALVTDSVRESFFKQEVPFGSIIYQEAKKHNVRPELVAAVVQAESRFRPTARSGAGAVGLMQLVPKTGRWMGARDLTNPVQNISAGTKYLRYLSDRFDGNETKIIAAYNAGEGNVQRFGGVPPFKETRNYIKKVRSYEADFKNRVESHGAGLVETAVELTAEAR